MKYQIVFVLLLLLAVPAILPAQQGAAGMQEDDLAKAWSVLTPESKTRLLTVFVGEALTYASVDGPAELKRRGEQFPFEGIGIQYVFDAREKTADGATSGFQVLGVWLDSPAYAAGIRPGDWLVEVNNKPVCSLPLTESEIKDGISPERKKETDACVKSVSDFFGISSPVTLRIERGGAISEFRVTKAVIGRDVRKFYDDHAGEWQKEFAGLATELQKLSTRLNEARNDDGALNACYTIYRLIEEQLLSPKRAFSGFIRSRLATIPETE